MMRVSESQQFEVCCNDLLLQNVNLNFSNRSQLVIHSFVYQHKVMISRMTTKKPRKQLTENIPCFPCRFHSFHIQTTTAKSSKQQNQQQSYWSPPRQTLQAEHLQPVRRRALKSLLSGTWTNRWEAALTIRSGIFSMQSYQWQTEPSLRFQYTGHVPILRAVSTVDPTVYKRRVQEESGEREASAEYRPEQSLSRSEHSGQVHL